MHDDIISWFKRCAKTDEFNGKRILEVGSLNINGSLRPIIENMKPKEYIGIDAVAGLGVDLVLPAEKITEHFGLESFDVVVSTETLEHVLDWRTVIVNMKELLKPLGFIYITVPPFTYPYHPHPRDCWRYTTNDMAKIFDDFSIWNLNYGLFLKARKPKTYVPIDLSNIPLYSMKLKARTKEIVDNDGIIEKGTVDTRKSMDTV